jgi:hypothetical protein
MFRAYILDVQSVGAYSSLYKVSSPSAFAGFLLYLLFRTKDASSMFLQNIKFCPYYTMLQPRRLLVIVASVKISNQVHPLFEY